MIEKLTKESYNRSCMAKDHDQDQAVIVANTKDQIFTNFVNNVCAMPFKPFFRIYDISV